LIYHHFVVFLYIYIFFYIANMLNMVCYDRDGVK
jgi:hypothetical protein